MHHIRQGAGGKFVVTRRGGFALAVLIAVLLDGCVGGIRIERTLRERADDWITSGGNNERTQECLHTLVPPLKPVWEFNALAGISGSPLVKDSLILVATLKGELHAVRLADGEDLGSMNLESAAAGTPVWDGSNVYIASALGTETLSCVFLREGKPRWTAKVGPVETSLLMIGEFLYVTTLDGTLLSIKKADGTEFWKYETADKEHRKPIHSSPASDGEVVVFGSDDGFIYAVERLTGALRWKFQTGASVLASPVIQKGMCFVGSLDGWMYALDAHTGQLRWKYDAHSKIYAPAAASGSLLVFGAADGAIAALDLRSGVRRWEFHARSVVSSAPLLSGDCLYIGSLDRTLYALKLDSGEKIWEYEAVGRIRVSPVIWGDMLLLTSEDKFITALRPEHP